MATVVNELDSESVCVLRTAVWRFGARWEDMSIQDWPSEAPLNRWPRCERCRETGQLRTLRRVAQRRVVLFTWVSSSASLINSCSCPFAQWYSSAFAFSLSLFSSLKQCRRQSERAHRVKCFHGLDALWRHQIVPQMVKMAQWTKKTPLAASPTVSNL